MIKIKIKIVGMLRGSFVRQPVRSRKRWAFFSEKSVRGGSGKWQASVREKS